MGNIFNTFSYKNDHINVKKIQKFEKVRSRVKMRNQKNHRNIPIHTIIDPPPKLSLVTKLHCAYHITHQVVYTLLPDRTWIHRRPKLCANLVRPN
jgi:hypothetical protein